MRPEEELPVVDAGDRVIGIVRYRDIGEPRVKPHIVILIATETGWKDAEHDGYTLHDCELWTLEKDLVSIADAVG
jgi:hypothetical protein